MMAHLELQAAFVTAASLFCCRSQIDRPGAGSGPAEKTFDRCISSARSDHALPSKCALQRSLVMRFASAGCGRTIIAMWAAARLLHAVHATRCSGPKRLFISQHIDAGKRYRAVMPTC
ncbi:hypothetical protein [Xanthomonas arboricola]|uniref:hypothetical protein n=1 Tax=Xanthomonas arboricola TaxID=56448 RepID=UPI0011B053B5|nr:hypothetical protein [Xanthomonas arboricola]